MKNRVDTIFAITLLVVFLGALTQMYFYYFHINGVVESKDYRPAEYSENFQPGLNMNSETGEIRFDMMQENVGNYHHYTEYYIIVLTKNNKGKVIHKRLSVSQAQWEKISVGDTVVDSKVMIKHK